MKRVVFDSSSHVSYEEARARFKHQTLLQDFLELHQETEASRNKLMALKQKKLTLQAEVRFLRRRHKFLLKNKSSTPQARVFAKPKPTRFRKPKKEKACVEKKATLCNLRPAQKKKAAVFDLNLENGFHGVNEQSVQRAIRGSNLNQRVRINGPKAGPTLDLNEKINRFGGQEPVGRTRVPVIDLNQVSREEEEAQDGVEQFDSQTQGLPACRKVGGGSGLALGLGLGSGSSGRAGNRKISWQDPVALRV